MKFRAASPTATLTIEAPTWHSARQYALSQLGENISVERVADDAVPDVHLRYVGVDLNGDTRRMQVRKRGGRWR
jgi:hypothetical protein